MKVLERYGLFLLGLLVAWTLQTVTVAGQTNQNKPPLLVYPNPQSVLIGGTLSVKPKLGLTDNTSVKSVSVSSILPQTFTGSVTVNSAGIVNIMNPGTPGTYTIAIRAVDSQNSVTIARFRLRVRTIECLYYKEGPSMSTGIASLKYGPAVGDFNNDGNTDVVVLETQVGGISILLGDGAGNFTKPANSFTGGLITPYQAEPADFNRDGFLDLAVRTPFGFTIVQGNGSGVFTLGSNIALPTTDTHDITVGDFNNDGRPDVAFTYSINSNRKIYVYLNTALLGFIAAPGSPKSVSSDPGEIESRDFNNDGKLDLAVEIGNTVAVYLGDGTGAFNTSAQLQFPSLPGLLEDIVAEDLNHDGNEDLAITSDQSYPDGTFAVYLGDGTGHFTLVGTLPTSYEQIGLITADINSDGHRDLVSGRVYATGFTPYVNDGYGFFNIPLLTWGLAPPHSTLTAASEDFNNDGEADFAMLNSGWVGVLLHTACAPTFDPGTIEVRRCEAATQKTLGTVISDDFSAQQLTLNPNSVIPGLSISNLAMSGNNVVALVDAADNAPLGSYPFFIVVMNPNDQWVQKAVTVNVVDCPVDPLTIIQPSSINTTSSPDSCGTAVNYATPQTTGGTAPVIVSCTPASGSVFPVGSTTVNCSATDSAGAQASTSFQVNVTDNKPPQFSNLADITVNAAQGECSAIVNFVITATDNCSNVTVTTNPVSGSVFPAGMTTVTATATDSAGNISTGTFKVTVIGSGGPALSDPVASPNSLWPPNHTMKNVDVSYTATAGCGGGLSCTLSVTSNEPENSGNDGDTAPDWQILNAHKVKLRSERSGAGTGRIYTITVTCTDAAGNKTVKSTTVTVPL